MRSSESAKLKQYANNLRKNLTDAESALWYHLRKRQLGNVRFLKQKIIGGFIVDFVSLEKKLIIELDGEQHVTQSEYDQQRTQQLNALGYRVIRFWNGDVLRKIDWVLTVIWFELFGEL